MIGAVTSTVFIGFAGVDLFLKIYQSMTSTTPNITKFMPSKKSIIFELNNNLRVYAIDDSVKQDENQLVLLREIVREGKVLELGEKFEFLWQDLNDSGYFDNVNEIFFLIGSHAGFTDSRMVFIWLKSWVMFNQVNIFYIKKTEFDVPIDFISVEILIETLTSAKAENNSTKLTYSKEPNITNNFQG
jgi:hypothetical protein